MKRYSVTVAAIRGEDRHKFRITMDEGEDSREAAKVMALRNFKSIYGRRGRVRTIRELKPSSLAAS